MLRLSCLGVQRTLGRSLSPAVKRSASSLPPRQSGGGGGKLVAGTLFVVGGTVGGVVAYASTDKEFRKTVESSVPGSGDVFNSILGPIDPPATSVKPKAVISPPSKLKISSPVVVSPPAKKEEKIEKEAAAKSVKVDSPAKETVAAPMVPEPPMEPPPKPAAVETKKPKEATSSVKEDKPAPPKKEAKVEEPAPASSKVPETKAVDDVLPADIDNSSLEQVLNELCKEMKSAASAAVDSYDQSAQAVVAHINIMQKVLEANISSNDESAWDQVFQAASVKSEAVKAAEFREKEAEAAIRNVVESIEAGRKNRATSTNPQLIVAEEAANRALYQVEQAKARIAAVESEARVMEQYRDLVEEGRQQFHREMSSIMPDVKLGEKNTKLTEDELNMFITHAYRKVLHLQQELAKQQTLEQQRFKQSLEKQRLEAQMAASEKIDSELERQKRELEVEHQRRLAAIREEAENELRSQLRRQAAAHSDHITDVLTVQEAELQRKHSHELDEKLSDLDTAYLSTLSAVKGRIAGLESALETRAGDDKAAVEAQKLWLACVSMELAVREGNSGAKTWEETVRPLNKAVKTIKEAAGSEDEFVKTVLDTIPQTALTRGIYTEQSLRERFDRVETVARRVGSIGEEGGSLASYGLSYLKSLLMIDISKRNPGVKSDEPIDVSQLSTVDILSIARHSLEVGDIARAVQLMGLLEGEPRRVARGWLDEARLHLETRQAAQVLLAHAATLSAEALPNVD